MVQRSFSVYLTEAVVGTSLHALLEVMSLIWKISQARGAFLRRPVAIVVELGIV